MFCLVSLDFEDGVEAYVDVVVAVGENKVDLLIIDAICRWFEAIFTLNRCHKTAILGMEGSTGQKEWPLEWIGAPDQLKTFGVTCAPLWHQRSSSLGKAA
jgi:glycerate kinase